MAVSQRDKEILKPLIHRYAAIANHPIQQETLKAWKANNGLRPVRPLYIIEQLPGGEINVDSYYRLKCEDGFARGIENDLRWQLFRWDTFPDDRVLLPEISVGLNYSCTHLGMVPDEEVIPGKNGAGANAHVCKRDQLQSLADVENIAYSRVTLAPDAWDKARERRERIQEIVGDTLQVRIRGGISPYGHIWDEIIRWHGIDQSIIDLIDNPDLIHAIVRRTMDVYIDQVRQFEKLGLIDPAPAFIHCTGAYTDELPGYNTDSEAEYDKLRYSAKNTWACAAAQIFAVVSPDMHDEFEIEYQKEWFSLFGMGYYGCCEALDRKIDIIRKLPNIRKISMSPWADMERGAEAINGDYVFSRKPSPAFFSGDSAWNPGLIRKDLEDCLSINQKFGNPVEFILKDLSTIDHRIDHLTQWAKIAADVCGRQQPVV